MSRFIEVHSQADGPLSVRVDSIDYYRPYGLGCILSVHGTESLTIRESYEEVKSLIKDSRTGGAGARLVKPTKPRKVIPIKAHKEN